MARDIIKRVLSHSAIPLKPDKWSRAFYKQWQRLSHFCPDLASQKRLRGLREQFEQRKRGVCEAAAAEVELAALLSRAGFSVAFLQETQDRTADLECYLGFDRLFVEITVIVPTPSTQKLLQITADHDETDALLSGDHNQGAIVRRLLARIKEKAKQMSRYCAPVVLAITVPGQERNIHQRKVEQHLDLKRLSGVLVNALVGTPQLSAVLLTFWNIQPQEPRSNLRLANVYYVTRSTLDPALPRVQLLAMNPFAKYCLTREEMQALRKAI